MDNEFLLPVKYERGQYLYTRSFGIAPHAFGDRGTIPPCQGTFVKMPRYRLVTLFSVLVFTVSASVEDENYIVEDIPEAVDRQYDVTRSARFFSVVQNPIIDFMMKTASISYVPKNPGDFFDFLRDSYSLPGGKRSILIFMNPF